jgi:arginine exporter protein ArgO
MSLSVSITGLLTGLSLIVAIGGQNVSKLTSAVTTLRTSGVRDVNDLSRSNH